MKTSPSYRRVSPDEPAVATLVTPEPHDHIVMGVAVAPIEEFFVNLKTLDDRTIRVVCGRSGTLREFRTRVEVLTAVPPARQRLITNGRLLTDEDGALGVERGGFVHLAPIAVQVAGESVVQNDTQEPDSVIHTQLSKMTVLAWCVLVWFMLLVWGNATVLAFDDETEHKPIELAILDLVIGLFGVFVGWFGLRAANRDVPVATTRTRVRAYSILLTLLATTYIIRFLTTLGGVGFASTVIVMLYLQIIFGYCVLQANVTHRALRPVGEGIVLQQNSSTPSTTAASISQVQTALPMVVLGVPATEQYRGQPDPEWGNSSIDSNNTMAASGSSRFSSSATHDVVVTATPVPRPRNGGGVTLV